MYFGISAGFQFKIQNSEKVWTFTPAAIEKCFCFFISVYSSLWLYRQTFYEEWFQLLCLGGVLPAVRMQRRGSGSIAVMYTPPEAMLCCC